MTISKSLTEVQAETLIYIMSFIEDAGYPPTYREIAAHFETSLQTVTDRLLYIEKKGYIARDGRASYRAIAVLANSVGEAVRLKFYTEKTIKEKRND